MSTIQKALQKKIDEQALINEEPHKDVTPSEVTADLEPVTKQAIDDISTTAPSPLANDKDTSRANDVIKLCHKRMINNHFLTPFKLEQANNEEEAELRKEQSLLRGEFKQIKRKLINNAFGAMARTLHNSNLVMITSSQANEGKTFISINLAVSVALEQDKTVLLIDADVLKPSIPKTLGFENRPGLIDYLLGDVDDIADIIYPTNVDNFRIIPSGRYHYLANELLASEKMAALCTQLSQRYSDRLVVFDTPPLLGINETAILGQLMGQALIVVEENRSSIHEIQKANELLPDSLAKGTVMNKAIHSHKDNYGYYGYGYGYGTK
ncbi:XrtA-associated tyrosine autokinase [Thalassotalea maritima]|uniref:XrtA-associated tyrosine autokinase n=1 Tax=Thalassotalea maritima TaxID=3242416 RepID=UPI0035279973